MSLSDEDGRALENALLLRESRSCWEPVAQAGQLGQNRILFRGAFQSPQRVGRPSDEPPAEDFLDELSPPAWGEDEVSVECHAA